MGFNNQKCKPVTIGFDTTPAIPRNFNLGCGEEQIYYEAVLTPLPTLTISAIAFPFQEEVNCQTVLVIEQGDGSIIERPLPDNHQTLSLSVPNVRRVSLRCETSEGRAGCTGFLAFLISYCACTGLLLM
ncbi:hypothetical protein SM124_13220 [Bacillus sp. 31A1R]|uniref:CUB domain-containing protein n=1 Tax=Robertmurraya mangrovi TaxID=3098077 RepID=A0ABU5IZV5_9BACI|nr:hypothetical protein [Bacillus sp. 31A1R]MDZ5472693.1 hypothetical protein [Bacillus sp. 31A1R]